MILIATPDFVAGGIIVLFVFAAWLLAIAGSILLIIRALKKRKQSGSRRKIYLYLFMALILPLFCWQGPIVRSYLLVGRAPLESYPLHVINNGTSMEQVRDILGKPNGVTPGGTQGSKETWFYEIGKYGVFDVYIEFNKNDRVMNIYGH